MALALRQEAAATAAEIITALETAHDLPEAALRLAVERADEIAPNVIALVEQAAAGVYLLPHQENLLFWGVHALAAARRTELCPPLLHLLRESSEVQLDRLLGDSATETIGQVVIAVFDGDHARLVDACADNRLGGFLRWSLMQALARLTFDGKIPHPITVDFVDRFEREALAAPGDFAWEGWNDLIILLGMEHMRERLRASLDDGRNASNSADFEHMERDLAIAVALAPGDPSLFEKEGIAALSDPVEPLLWTAPRETDADRADDDDRDPARGIALRDFEIRWLAGFLRSDKVPPLTIPFEQVDGLFCALIAGPSGAQFADCTSTIWNLDDTANAEPRYDSAEQAHYVDALLRRHWTAVAQRLERSYPHGFITTEGHGVEQGRYWARGFIYGMMLRRTQWQFRLGDTDFAKFVRVIVSLSRDEATAKAEGLTPSLRSGLLQVLPRRLVAIHHAWRGRADPFPPVRATPSRKIGRNAPCSCGSGKKYKRCCGVSERRL